MSLASNPNGPSYPNPAVKKQNCSQKKRSYSYVLDDILESQLRQLRWIDANFGQYFCRVLAFFWSR